MPAGPIEFYETEALADERNGLIWETGRRITSIIGFAEEENVMIPLPRGVEQDRTPYAEYSLIDLPAEKFMRAWLQRGRGSEFDVARLQVQQVAQSDDTPYTFYSHPQTLFTVSGLDGIRPAFHSKHELHDKGASEAVGVVMMKDIQETLDLIGESVGLAVQQQY